jgi:hypothetical protein
MEFVWYDTVNGVGGVDLGLFTLLLFQLSEPLLHIVVGSYGIQNKKKALMYFLLIFFDI